MIDICQFKSEDIEDAIVALGELRDHLVPFFQRTNLDGMGETDAKAFTGHIALAQRALVAMAGFMDFVLHSKDPKQLHGPNGVSFSAAMSYMETSREMVSASTDEQAAKAADVFDLALFAMRLLWSAAGTLPEIDGVNDG